MKAQIKKIIKGYNNKQETQLFVDRFIEECRPEYIFKGNGIEKPSYEEILKYQEVVRFPFKLDKDSILRDIEAWLRGELDNIKEIADIITIILNECHIGGLSETILKNVYIRILIAIKSKFLKVIKEKGYILYLRTPDKYEFLVLTVLEELGVNILIMDIGSRQEIEYLCSNKFEVQEGNIKDILNYNKIEVKEKGLKIVSNIVNKWYNFNNCKTPEDYLDVLNNQVGNRQEGNTWKTINLEIVGVPSDEDNYPILVNSVIQKSKALGRKYLVLENGIYNPKFEENEKFNLNYNPKTINASNILKSYPLFNKSSIQVEVDNYINQLIVKRQFTVESQKENYIKVLYIWLIRYLDIFFMERKLEKMPLAVIWGKVNQREEEFIALLSLFPIDIIHFSPNIQDTYKDLSMEEVFRVRFGESSDRFELFPKNNIINKVATVAYNAERELDTILYTGTEGLYRPNQFKNIAPVVLKTTYEEIEILWEQQAKFRPSFETIGNLVNVGTIFAKVNGIQDNKKQEYLDRIKRMINSDTIVYQKLPFTTELADNTMSSFVRQVIFNKKVDFEKIKKSPYYKYGVYSEETQELIISKIEQLLTLDWCNEEVRNLIYKTIETIFTLPTDIVQLIHSYDFTSQIPKLILFSGDTGVCSLEDSIVIMFLKLVGFDILVLAPTGYRLIEQYIKPGLFNNINIGEYDFSLQTIDITSKREVKPRRGIFKNIFRN